MKRVFVDTFHYIAVLSPRDRYHADAVNAGRALEPVEFVTTDAILVEVLAFYSSAGPRARREAVSLVDVLRADPDVLVLPQTREMFDEGLALYRQRLDKGYSLTDCMSMAACRELEIDEVLTHDQHFAQEGFGVLL